MGLRRFLDGLEHHFQEGGRFQKYYALYEVFDTFLYSPSSVTRTTAHVRDGVDLKRIMITVWLAAFPAMFYGMYNLGFQAASVLPAGQGVSGWHGWLIETFGGYGVCEIADFQTLLRHICENGFEHHVAINPVRMAAGVREALGNYLGWAVHWHR